MRKRGQDAADGMIRDVLRVERGRIALIALGRVLLGAQYMVFVLLSRALVDGAVAGDLPALARAAVWLALIVLGRVALTYFVRRLDAGTQQRALIRMRTQMYAEILRKKQRALDSFHSTVLLERLTGDLPNVIYYPVTALPGYAGSLAGFVCAVGALFSINRLLPAALLLAGLVIGGVGRLLQRRVKDNFRAYSAANEQTGAYYQETMANSLMLKVFKAQPYARARADAFEANALNKWKRWYAFNQLLKTGVGAFFQTGYLGAMIFCAVMLARGELSYGGMTAILQLVDEVQDPFSSLGDLMSARYGAQASAERLLEIADLPREDDAAIPDAWALYRDMKELRVEGLTFGYDERLPVFADASASLRKGDFVVVSGRSGIGKSTLFMLLLGVYEDYSGTVSLVKTDGERVPLCERTRPLFSYVPQTFMLFSGTVRDNLCFLCGQASDEALWAAARIADAEDFLRALPDGLDTRLNEGGAGLSNGQAQRLAIARALLRNAPILILDEATSALDEETEQRVLQNLREMKDITLLVISHRRAAYAVCSREWRVADGRIEGRDLTADDR